MLCQVSHFTMNESVIILSVDVPSVEAPILNLDGDHSFKIRMLYQLRNHRLPYPGNTKGGSITAPLTCLTGLH
jgi:hypothetical protein